MNDIVPRSQLEWMAIHADVVIPHVGARFFLGRTRDGNFCHVASDVPVKVADQLRALVAEEPVSSAPEGLPEHAAAYAEVFAQAEPVQRQWLGPAFHFPRQVRTVDPGPAGVAVQVTPDNIHLLQPAHVDWIADVGPGDPVCLLQVQQTPVAVCYSAAKSSIAHEAGVETVVAHRGHGYALAIVSAWAQAVRGLGVEPLYSTSQDNVASQAVAARLGLIPIGMDFHLS